MSSGKAELLCHILHVVTGDCQDPGDSLAWGVSGMPVFTVTPISSHLLGEGAPSTHPSVSGSSSLICQVEKPRDNVASCHRVGEALDFQGIT